MQQPATEANIYKMGKWEVHEWAEASSTNDLARTLAPWSIARCDEQTSGRGRFNRPWIGAKGGLWCSFTVPLDSVAPFVNCGHLPLVAGLAMLDILEHYRVETARLRWPNDLLIENSKLAGILVERPSRSMAIIGIGVNVINDMELLAGKTKDTAISLSQLLSPCPPVTAVLEQLAERLHIRLLQFSQGGLSSISTDLKQAWKDKKEVTIQTDDGDIIGIFAGIDDQGNPLIEQQNGDLAAIPAHTVNRLIEN